MEFWCLIKCRKANQLQCKWEQANEWPVIRLFRPNVAAAAARAPPVPPPPTNGRYRSVEISICQKLVECSLAANKFVALGSRARFHLQFASAVGPPGGCHQSNGRTELADCLDYGSKRGGGKGTGRRSGSEAPPCELDVSVLVSNVIRDDTE